MIAKWVPRFQCDERAVPVRMRLNDGGGLKSGNKKRRAFHLENTSLCRYKRSCALL